MPMQEADGNLDSARMELTQLRERSDSEFTRLGNEYDLKKQSLEDLEVSLLLYTSFVESSSHN